MEIKTSRPLNPVSYIYTPIESIRILDHACSGSRYVQQPAWSGNHAYISSGGPGNPLERHFPWYSRWISLMDDLLHNHEGKKHVFLICHSFQVMCHHLQIADVKLRKSPAFGVFPVHKSEYGLKEPLFEKLNNPFYAVDSRSWQVIQPHDDKLKAIEPSFLYLHSHRIYQNIGSCV